MQVENDTQIEAVEEFRMKVSDAPAGVKVNGQALHLTIFDDDDPHSAPVADGCACGSPDAVKAGSPVTLDGSFSHAKTGRTLAAYHWQQVGGPTVTLDSADSMLPRFTAPPVAVREVMKFKLTVTDNFGVSNSAIIEVAVEP
jgi:hypothetical protein